MLSVETLLCLSVALFLLLAAISKGVRFGPFAKSLADLGFPKWSVPAVGVTVPSMELFIAALLPLPSSRHLAATLLSLLSIGFVVVLASSLARGKRPDCSCFLFTAPRQIGGRSVLRAVILLLLSLGLYYDVFSKFNLQADDVRLSLNMAGILGVLIVFVALTSAALALLRQNIRLLNERDKCLVSAMSTQAEQRMTLGDDFSMLRSDGSTFSVESIRSLAKPCALIFVSASCPACQMLKDSLLNILNSLSDRLSVVLAVPLGGGGKFSELPVIAEYEDAGLLKTYGAHVFPTMILVAPDGEVLTKAEGPNAILERLTEFASVRKD